MAFTPPNFNLLGRSWNPGNTPAANPPDFVALPQQLYVNSRVFVDLTVGTPTQYTPAVFIRAPLPTLAYLKGSIVESVTGSSDFYLVRWMQNCHQGFPNVYLMCLVEQCTATGATPRP